MNRSDITAIQKSVVTLICLALVGWLLFSLRELIVAVFVAVILASAITPIAETLERKKIPRLATILAVYAGVALIYVLFAVALWPALKEQAIMLYKHIPNYIDNIMSLSNRLTEAAQESGHEIDVQGFLQDLGGKAIGRTLDLTKGLFGLFGTALLVLFLTAYFVIEAKAILEQLLLWVPPARRGRCADLLRPLEARLGGYVRGQVLVSIAVATFLGTGLSLLKVNYSLVLGMLSGLCNLVPFVGSMLACVFSIVVASNQSPYLGIATLILFAIEQWLESNFIVPHLVGRNTDLHPLIVLFAILIGASLMGLPGALIAVPVASALLFLAREFYLKPLNAGSASALELIAEQEGGAGPASEPKPIQEKQLKEELFPVDRLG